MRELPASRTTMAVAICALWLVNVPPAPAMNSQATDPAIVHPAAACSEVEIQRALDQLPAGGGTVVLAPGRYQIHRPLCLQRNGLTLRGSGELTILHLVDRADCPVIIVGSTSVGTEPLLHDLCVSDLVIDGNRSHQSVEGWRDPRNTSGIQNNGIMIQAVSNSIVERVVAAHCRSGGLVTANGTRHLTVSNFTAFDNQFDGLAGYRTEDSLFTKLNLHDNRAAGISLDLDFNHNVITDSVLTRNDLGIFMRDSLGNQFHGVTINQSRHDGVFMAQWGIGTTSGWMPIPQTECTGNQFSGLKIEDCAGIAFCVHDAACVNNVIQDGMFSGNLNGGLAEAVAKLARGRALY